MKRKDTFLWIVALIFGIVAVLHLLRIINKWPANIGLFVIPLWASWIALIIAVLLCFFALRLIKSSR